MEHVILNAGPDDDDFFIEGTPVDSVLSISANDGDDEFYVGSGPSPAAVQDIHNLVSINGGSGRNTAIVDDAADGSGDLLTVTDKTVGAGANDTFFGLGGKLKYHALSELTITTSSGSDTINIESVAEGTDTTINANRGDDTITVAGPVESGADAGLDNDKIHRKATVDGLKSLLTINGGVGLNTLNVIDNLDTTADTMTLTDMTIGMGPTDTFLGSSSAGIIYTAIYNLSIWMGSGGNQVFVESTHPGTANVFVATGKGNDTLLVQNVAGTANDIRSRLEIDGQNGQDVATVDDNAETLVSALTITPSQVLGDETYFGSGGELNYAGWEVLLVNAGQAGDTVTVTGTNPVTGSSPGTVTKINTGGGTDLVTVGLFDTVDFVRSSLEIDGGSALGAVVALLDTSDGTPDEFTITDTSVGAMAGDQFFGPFGSLQYSNLRQLNVAAGLGHNVINLQSTAPTTEYLVGGGGGDDIFTIDSNGAAAGGTVDFVTSQITLVGGSGNNALILEDADDASGDTVSLTPTSANAGVVGQGPSDDFFGPGGSISYSQITALALRGSDVGADSFNVAPAPAGGTIISVDGNNPATAPQDKLNFALSGITSPVVTVTDIGSGLLSSGSHQWVLYRDMEVIDESTGSLFDLMVDMTGAAMGGNDGVADKVEAGSGQFAGVKTLTLRINGSPAFSGIEWAINSMTVVGSSDDDTLAIIETANGLPRLPGTAPLGHSNAAFAASGLAPQNVGIHYDGGPGVGIDQYDLVLSSPLDVYVFQDLIGVPKSGVVNVKDEFTMSYESLTPILVKSAGGTLTMNASLLTDMTELLLTDLGDGRSRISGDGGFETTTFSGIDQLVVVPPSELELRATHRVNSWGDEGDANPGDGVCRIATGSNICTLRAAIEETNAVAGPAHVNLDISGARFPTRRWTHLLPLITDDVAIDGYAPTDTRVNTISASHHLAGLSGAIPRALRARVGAHTRPSFSSTVIDSWLAAQGPETRAVVDIIPGAAAGFVALPQRQFSQSGRMADLAILELVEEGKIPLLDALSEGLFQESAMPLLQAR